MRKLSRNLRILDKILKKNLELLTNFDEFCQISIFFTNILQNFEKFIKFFKIIDENFEDFSGKL